MRGKEKGQKNGTFNVLLTLVVLYFIVHASNKVIQLLKSVFTSTSVYNLAGISISNRGPGNWYNVWFIIQ